MMRNRYKTLSAVMLRGAPPWDGARCPRSCKGHLTHVFQDRYTTTSAAAVARESARASARQRDRERGRERKNLYFSVRTYSEH